MNKKSKRITLGLVSALCLLLVVALGFGVTGAWYRARRQATGVVQLDNGINLAIKNMDQAGGIAPTASSTNYLWRLNPENTSQIVPFGGVNAVSFVPGDKVDVAIPEIGAAEDSIDFYAKAKVIYEFTLVEENKSDVAGTFGISDLFQDKTGTAETLAHLFNGTQLTFDDDNWTHLGSQADVYFYTGVKNGTAPAALPAYANSAVTYKALFEAENPQPTNSVTGVDFKTVNFYEWTGGNNIEPAAYVEFAGPAVYTRTGEDPSYTYSNKRYISGVTIKLIIDVIQKDNVGTYNSANDASPITALETWVNAPVTYVA